MRNEKRLERLEDRGMLKSSVIKVYIVWPEGRIWHDGKEITKAEYEKRSKDDQIIYVKEKGNYDD